MSKDYYVYVLTNENNNVMYIGITNDLKRRVYEHKSNTIEGFTKKYHVHKLVYYEITTDVNSAIAREKQLKKWKRAKKNALVETLNPKWKELTIEEKCHPERSPKGEFASANSRRIPQCNSKSFPIKGIPPRWSE